MGGWAFADVARALRAAGHDVYPMTLTGLGERSHLARREVDLDTHIGDVVNLLKYEDLRDAVLVGHSYAGIVITGVADRAGERLSTVAFLDTAPAAHGQRHIQFYPPEMIEKMQKQVHDEGDGWRLPFPGFERLGPPPMLAGLGADARAKLEARAVAQPFATYTQPLHLTGKAGNRHRQVFIACNGFREIVKTQPEVAAFLTPAWQRYDLATGHWPMLSAPQPLAEILGKLTS
jgi:pimeloyl-ACP methyl ester carboxylesterase